MVYNYEYEKEELINNPNYYIQGIYNKLFHKKRFLKFIILGFIEGGILFIFSNFWFDKGNSDGTTNDFYAITSVSYAGIVIICNLKVILDTSYHDIISASFVSFCIISYYISVAVYSKDYIFSEAFKFKYGTFYGLAFFIHTFCNFSYACGCNRFYSLAHKHCYHER